MLKQKNFNSKLSRTSMSHRIKEKKNNYPLRDIVFTILNKKYSLLTKTVYLFMEEARLVGN